MASHITKHPDLCVTSQANRPTLPHFRTPWAFIEDGDQWKPACRRGSQKTQEACSGFVVTSRILCLEWQRVGGRLQYVSSGPELLSGYWSLTTLHHENNTSKWSAWSPTSRSWLWIHTDASVHVNGGCQAFRLPEAKHTSTLVILSVAMKPSLQVHISTQATLESKRLQNGRRLFELLQEQAALCWLESACRRLIMLGIHGFNRRRGGRPY